MAMGSASSALPLSYDNRTTTSPHKILCIYYIVDNGQETTPPCVLYALHRPNTRSHLLHCSDLEVETAVLCKI